MHVSALLLYPVKSCRRVPLQRALLTPEGLAFDRAWVVVDAQGKIITQREQPRLALVRARASACRGTPLGWSRVMGRAGQGCRGQQVSNQGKGRSSHA